LTGSPGDGNANCTQCHSGTPNSVNDWITSDVPSSGYVPGQTYTITTTGTHSGVGKFGFELTSEDESGNKVGSIVVTNDTETQLTNGGLAITHTSQGNIPSGDTKSWSCDWIAPIDVDGPVTFFASINAADGNGTGTGDVIYLTSTTITKDLTFISDLASHENLWIYPNPSNGKFNLVLPQSNDYKIAVYDLMGQIIKEINTTKGLTEIDLGKEKAGLYFIKIHGDDIMITRRLIIKD
jgi:hypothetical protein